MQHRRIKLQKKAVMGDTVVDDTGLVNLISVNEYRHSGLDMVDILFDKVIALSLQKEIQFDTVVKMATHHGKYLIFRTWDCFPDRFHSNLKYYYLEVTDKVQEDEQLIFSMKHTALDFWRRVKFNPCIGRGKHRQVIEVQCQREYEGKGAYPSYVMSGVINGFPEMVEKKGLRDVVDNPLVCGIFAWPRGGGWYGPYLQNEFWCDLNTYVIAAYAGNPHRTEEEIFLEYACKKMGMDLENARKFYTLCTEKIPEAILRGRYIEAYDVTLHEEAAPCENWIRDDRIGGLRQLNVVFFIFGNK